MGRNRGRPTTFVDPVVGERIKSAYKSAKLTQERLAEMLNNGIDDNGFQQRTISNWVRGDTKPSDFVLQQIAEICNVSYSWLSNQEGKVKRIISESRNILDSFSSEHMEEHDYLERLLIQKGYDIVMLEMENSNFVAGLKRRIDRMKHDDIETVIDEYMFDYETWKEGLRK